MTDDIFCKIANRQVDAFVVYETKLTIAFLDNFPATLGHTLLIPKKHYADLPEMLRTKPGLMTLKYLAFTAKDILGPAIRETLVEDYNKKEVAVEIPEFSLSADISHLSYNLLPRSKEDGYQGGEGHWTWKGRTLEEVYGEKKEVKEFAQRVAARLVA